MQHTESLGYKCTLDMQVIDNGKVVNEVTKSNLLLDNGKLIILSSLCDPNTPYGVADKMVFGDSDVTPDVADSFDEFGEYYTRPTKGFNLNLDTKNSVEIYWELSEVEFNNQTLKTIGLCSSGFVFNRVVLASEDFTLKLPTMKLVGKWTIEI